MWWLLPGLPSGPSAGDVNFAEGVLADVQGTCYVILVTDASNAVAESDETNNIVVQKYALPCLPPIFSATCIPR